MLAEVLHDFDRPRDALSHWKAVLQHTRHARQVPREQRMELVSTALDRGLSLVDDPNEVFGLMPTSDPAELAASREEPLVIEIREWDFGNPRDWDDICAVFVDGRVPRRGEVSDLKLTGGPQRAVAADNPLRLVSDCDTPRNDPCPCRSGRKYKKCCGRPAAAQSRAPATVGSGAS
ncbi:MAG: SEC-C domain-containing protein [Planctomycetes bacterium]|nr:SEC-C domain-containing protein [Planctomycetota bacterium]